MNFLHQGFRNLSYYNPRMRAFNYAWSLPWRGHFRSPEKDAGHTIRFDSRKPHATRKLHGSVFYTTV